jgi:hypothetical protein
LNPAAVHAAIREVTRTQISPIVTDIDEGLYPAEAMRALGEAGAYAMHTAPHAAADLLAAIEGTAVVSETCLSSGFMSWCQNTLAWYVANSDNAALKERFLEPTRSGEQLGGTGLSNPMKTFFGIERMKLKGRKVEGGYIVRGALPWVSNLGPDHLFGTIFEDEAGQPVMFLADCAAESVTLKPCEPFLAMDGTGTYAIQFRDAFIGDDMILADPAGPYIRRIRAGFILLQAGMAIGVIRDCVAMMNEVRVQLGHVNKYLDVQPEHIADQLAEIEGEVAALCATPYETDPAYWRRVVAARLVAGDASVAAAHAAMLHCGARGYVKAHRCQRRLREAYFVAIVTPATKQLRKMLAEMPG